MNRCNLVNSEPLLLGLCKQVHNSRQGTIILNPMRIGSSPCELRGNPEGRGLVNREAWTADVPYMVITRSGYEISL